MDAIRRLHDPRCELQRRTTRLARGSFMIAGRHVGRPFEDSRVVVAAVGDDVIVVADPSEDSDEEAPNNSAGEAAAGVQQRLQALQLSARVEVGEDPFGPSHETPGSLRRLRSQQQL